MSVINDMLNDLEQRQPQAAQTVNADPDLNPVIPANRRVRYIWWSMGLLMLSVVTWLAWRHASALVFSSQVVSTAVQPSHDISLRNEPILSALPTVDEPVEPVDIELHQVDEVPTTSTELNRIELDGQAGRYQIDLTFSNPLTPPPLQYRKGDRIWLRLYAATESNIELPEPAEDGPMHDWLSYLEDGYQMLSLRVDEGVDAELLQMGPQHWRVHLHSKSGEDEAAKDVEHAVPLVSEPQPNMQPVKQVQSMSQPARPAVKRNRQPFKEAEEALAEGRQKSAESLLKDLLNRQPKHLAASQLLSHLYLQTGRADLSESVVLAALQHYPQDPQLIGYFTRSLLDQERLDEAAAYLARVMQQQDASHLGLMAIIRQRQGNHQDASRYYTQALQMRPQEVTWLTGLAISQEHLNELTSARRAYQRSLASGQLSVALREFVEQRLQVLNRYE